MSALLEAGWENVRLRDTAGFLRAQRNRVPARAPAQDPACAPGPRAVAPRSPARHTRSTWVAARLATAWWRHLCSRRRHGLHPATPIGGQVGKVACRGAQRHLAN